MINYIPAVTYAIIDMIKKDGNTQKGYQEERDSIVKNIVKDIKNNQELLKDIDEQLSKLLPQTGYKLQTMPGINLITEAKIVSEIGDINRFPDSDKLARFMGLAPVHFSSAGKGKDERCRNGNRELNAIFHFLAIQMVAVSPSGKPRHPVFREYFEQKVKEGKNKPQALICISRTLVRLIYGMMKTKTEYRPYEKKEEEGNN